MILPRYKYQYLRKASPQYNCSAPQYQAHSALFTTLQYLVPLHQGISLPVPLLLINTLPSVTLYQSLSTSITLPQYQSLSTWYHSSTLPVLQCHRFFCAGLYLSVSQYQCHTSTVPVLQYLAFSTLQYLAWQYQYQQHQWCCTVSCLQRPSSSSGGSVTIFIVILASHATSLFHPTFLLSEYRAFLTLIPGTFYWSSLLPLNCLLLRLLIWEKLPLIVSNVKWPLLSSCFTLPCLGSCF